MTSLRIASVDDKLGSEPLVKRMHQPCIRCDVGELYARFYVFVIDSDLAGPGSFEDPQTRHLCAIDVRGPEEIALQKLSLDFAQVRAHKLDLLRVGGVLGDDPLHATSVRPSKDVRGGLQTEWHNVSAKAGDLRLPMWVGGHGGCREDRRRAQH